MSLMSDGTHLTTWVTRETKERFAAVARHQGLSDGIYRAMLRGDSTHIRKRVEVVHGELVKGELQVESGKAKLLRTREEVRHGWLAVSDELTRQGHPEIAAQVRRHLEQMPRPLTEKAYIATILLERPREPRVREIEMAR
jgi:hypothetical protein